MPHSSTKSTIDTLSNNNMIYALGNSVFDSISGEGPVREPVRIEGRLWCLTWHGMLLAVKRSSPPSSSLQATGKSWAFDASDDSDASDASEEGEEELVARGHESLSRFAVAALKCPYGIRRCIEGEVVLSGPGRDEVLGFVDRKKGGFFNWNLMGGMRWVGPEEEMDMFGWGEFDEERGIGWEAGGVWCRSALYRSVWVGETGIVVATWGESVLISRSR